MLCSRPPGTAGASGRTALQAPCWSCARASTSPAPREPRRKEPKAPQASPHLSPLPQQRQKPGLEHRAGRGRRGCQAAAGALIGPSPQRVSPGLPSLGLRLPCPPGSAPAQPGAGPSSTRGPTSTLPAPPPHPCPSLAGVREGRDQELTRTQPHTQRPASSNPQSHAASVLPCASVNRPHLQSRCDVALHVMWPHTHQGTGLGLDA